MFVDSELDAIKHDPTSDMLQHKMLKEMASDDSDPLRQDLAKDLLSGAITLAQAANSSVYGDIFTGRAEEVIDWWQDMSESERDELLAGAEESIKPYLDEPEPPR